MPNPKAPQRSVRVNEVQTECDHIVGRLKALGADPDEVADFVARWDDFDEEWTPAIRSAFVRSTDAQLRRSILDGRVEYAMHTEDVVPAAHEVTLDDAGLVLDRARNVDEVLRWVGTDRPRATAVLAVETSGANRVTLVTALRRIIA